MRYWKWIVATVLIGLAVFAFQVFGKSGPEFDVTTVDVDTGSVTMTIETLGNIEPLTSVVVGCETTGKIIEMTVDHDDPVTKDQIICRIDPELANADHAKSLAELERTRSLVADATVVLEEQKAILPVLTAQAKAQWDQTLAALDQAKFGWERTKRLYDESNAPEYEMIVAKASFLQSDANTRLAEARYNQAKSNEIFLVRRAEQALEQARAAAALAQANFETTEARVERCIIRSPIDGIVLKRFEEKGATVIAALTTPPLFLLAPSLDRVRVNAKVSETDIVHIDVGQKAKFKVEGKQTAEFDGTILHKRNHPENVQGVTTYTVTMEVQNDARHTLLPGMSVNVVIECEVRPSTARVPNSALRFKPPLPPQDIRKLLDAAVYPPEPRTSDGQKMNYCAKEIAWKYDVGTAGWKVVPMWVGITDNVFTEILAGGAAGDSYVTKFVQKASGGFDFKEALRQANPSNRSLN
ncbi:MAG: efflux RND transporter periplasmic adaptor subunit [Phycisphaerae bacterium]|nr:efflux RND transporter periplasmic adaptor subunit [Phycisphaerae bacterium]